MAARGRRPAIEAPRERWTALGERMQRRRAQLGYETRAAMARATGRPKRERTITDLEKGYRDTFQLDTLEWFCEVYQLRPQIGNRPDAITEFLTGKTDELEPAAPAAPAAPSAGILPQLTDPARTAAARPYADDIWERIDAYRDGHPGVQSAEIPGAALFGDGTADARAWDDPNLRRLFTISQMVWLLADIRRADAGRSSGRNGTTLAGA